MTIKDIRYVDGNIEARKDLRVRRFDVVEGKAGEVSTDFFALGKDKFSQDGKTYPTLIGAIRESNPNFEAWFRNVNEDLPEGPIMNQADERQGPLAEMIRIAQKGWHSTMPDGRLPDAPTQEEKDNIARTKGRDGLEKYMDQEFYASGGYGRPTYNSDHGHVSEYEASNLERFIDNLYDVPKDGEFKSANVKQQYAAFAPELKILRDALAGTYAAARPAAVERFLSDYRRDLNVAKNRGEVTFDHIPRASGPFTDAVNDKFGGLNGLVPRHDAVPIGWRPQAPV